MCDWVVFFSGYSQYQILIVWTENILYKQPKFTCLLIEIGLKLCPNLADKHIKSSYVFSLKNSWIWLKRKWYIGCVVYRFGVTAIGL